MSVLRTVILFLLLAFSQASTYAQAVRSEYYAVIPFWEIALTPFKGACPITETLAQDLLHLRLDYDAQNRVVLAEVKIGEHLKAFQGYSSLYVNAPRTRVTYEEGREIHHFFDHFGKQTTVMQDVYRKVYEKDPYGRNIRLRFENEAGAVAKDFFGYTHYEWTYEPEGTVIEERFNEEGELAPLRGDFHFVRTRVTYGTDGYPHILENVDEHGALVATETGATTLKYFYDKQGRFSRWEVYGADGKPATGPSDTAGEQNVFKGYHLQAIDFFDQVGEPVKHWSGAEKWFMEKDRFGNTTKRLFQQADGTLMNGYSGFAQTIYEWSADGRWLQAQYYLDAGGKPVGHPANGVAKTEYQRNDQGEILKTIEYEVVDGKYRVK